MDDLIRIKVEESVFFIKRGAPLSDLLSEIPLSEKPILFRSDGLLLDLSYPADREREISPVFYGDPEALEVLRHSAAHLLAHAVTDLFPGIQVGVGPAIENGFYYDFLRDTPFTPEDLEAIEKRMREIVHLNQPIQRLVLSKAEAIKTFQERGQTLKVELIQEKGGEQVSCYRQGDFIDFCLGPHLPATGYIQHFKLLSVSGAYWKGDERGPQMQRIYGTAFFTQKELEDYLNFLEEAKKRDHRHLGQELDLYGTSEDLGGGLVIWHPRGAIIRHLIEAFWKDEHLKDGYDFIYSPHIAKLDLWKRSGHTEFYEAMFPPLEFEGFKYQLKPMNCPFHIIAYKSRQRSYRELPLRWAELGTVYRYERSGVLHGLCRVRGFTQDDAHIFCRGDQLEEEIKRVIRLAIKLLSAFGFRDYGIYLATRPEKYVGRLEDWNKAEKALEEALKHSGLPYQVDEGEGVFYGPKIDIKIKDAIGRLWQCTTVQLDFNLAERFDLSYVGEDGNFHRPFLIHRALLGSMERFFGVLIEHYKGSFPLWLAPVQMVILPIADRHEAYARELQEIFRAEGFRVQVDDSREKVNKKIRQAELQKVPLMAIVGDKEVSHRNLSLRIHGQGDRGLFAVDSLLARLKELVTSKSLEINI
ncbi:MAG: threonine--tRNA ligase [Candidatus Saccharicenans sp.]|jgi:threonyl-tRNA synthetase|nr:threonine--tRNA ligase [Candidatus Saccharicenans sp.]MDH7494287.1 threonine--tRNA ligase [Candidatus Saccharicenans sp.]